MKIAKIVLKVEDMTCTGCEARIENELKKLEGVEKIKAEYAKAKVIVTYNSDKISARDIIQGIERAGYKGYDHEKKPAGGVLQSGENMSQLLGIGVIMAALYVIINNTIGFNFIPEVNQSMGYGILFVVGLLTSLHCIAMCGGINLSQCINYKHTSSSGTGSMKPGLLYNTGRVVSYTVIGGIVGGIGSVVSFSGSAKGIVAIIAGLFMIVMGVNMLGIFPWLKRFNPRMPKIFGEKIYGSRGKNGPFYVGLLNGLMPCGPLQAMQLYALGTGSVISGAMSMFFFSLGTVPLMLGFGTVITMFGKKLSGRLMKVSAVLVVVLGVIMMSRGMMLSGVNTTFADAPASGNIAVVRNGIQEVSIDLKPNRYDPVVVQKGIPVRFIINAEAENINGCNNAIIIPKHNIQKALMPGENIIEFIPEETGTVPYSCWMGMIGSSIKVVEDLAQVTEKDIESAEAGVVPGGGSGGCCGF